MIEVQVQGGNLERAIKAFSRNVLESGILRELRLREFYEKPSIKKKRKHRESLRRFKKKSKTNREWKKDKPF